MLSSLSRTLCRTSSLHVRSYERKTRFDVVVYVYTHLDVYRTCFMLRLPRSLSYEHGMAILCIFRRFDASVVL